MNTDFSKLHRQVVFDKTNKKIIWQPRIGCWYHDKLFNNEPLPYPYEGKTIPEIYRELNCSARIYQFNECFVPVENESVRITHEVQNEDIITKIETPVGRQTQVLRKSTTTRAYKHIKWFVESKDELKVAIWRAERCNWKWDQELFDKIQTEWDGLGAPTVHLPRVNIQDLYINTMGTQQAIYALYDWKDLVESYFRALDSSHDRLLDVVNSSPIDIINFGDNLHCGTLPPELFKKYVLPAYQSRCEKLHRTNKFVHSHWDGDVKALLPFAKDTGLDGIEAITPKPQGDVTLEEVKEALGDDLFLIDGIPAVYFDKTFEVSVLENCVRKIIEMFAPKLILGISDEISSTGDIERIRIVGEIVDKYNSKF